MRRSVEERFWGKVNKTDACWLWAGWKNDKGYGLLCAGIGYAKMCRMAHRYAYELLVGPIPVGLTLDHLCRVRNCVNPAHLEPVTIKENVLRGVGCAAWNARKTSCKRGHPLVPRRHDLTRRYCLTCRRASSLARRHNPKERPQAGKGEVG